MGALRVQEVVLGTRSGHRHAFSERPAEWGNCKGHARRSEFCLSFAAAKE